jgi:voltage-gated potassium channel
VIRNRVYIIVVLLVGMLLAGTIGYHLIEGWDWLDSAYMTVITLTTVGFGEINPMSPAGRLFTIMVILGGVGVMAYSLTSLSELIFSGELDRVFQRRRRAELKDHSIVCGFGRVGLSVAAELKLEGIPFIVIDKDPSAVEACRALGYVYVEGDASDAEVLKQAGLEQASSLVTAADSDAINVFIILTAREQREDIQIVTRLNDENSETIMRKAGADRVISPYSLAGHRIVHIISRPAVTDFLDTVLRSEEGPLWLEEIDIQPGSQLSGQSLGQAHLRSKFGVTVLAIDLPGQKVVTHPEASTLLSPGSRLIVLGARDQLKELSGLARGNDRAFNSDGESRQ